MVCCLMPYYVTKPKSVSQLWLVTSTDQWNFTCNWNDSLTKICKCCFLSYNHCTCIEGQCSVSLKKVPFCCCISMVLLYLSRRRRGSQNADSNVGSSQKMSDHDKQTLFTGMLTWLINCTVKWWIYHWPLDVCFIRTHVEGSKCWNHIGRKACKWQPCVLYMQHVFLYTWLWIKMISNS